MGDYEFDINGMDPVARERAADAARKIVNMADNAGHTLAADMLRARDHIDKALTGWMYLSFPDGWGDLPTGREVSKSYDNAHTQADVALRSMRATYQQMADHFLAMELLYLNTEERNGRRFNPYKDGTTKVHY